MPKEEPLVSVVIPVWNTGENISILIQGLLAQTYHNIEIIAVDDGSSDNSPSVLQELAKHDKRLIVVHQKNAGASAARNAGINKAQGKYITFIDSDDSVEKNFIARLTEQLEKDSEVALAATGMRYNKLQQGLVYNIYTKRYRDKRKNERIADYVLGILLRDGRLYGVIDKLFRLEPIKKYNIKFEVGRNFAEDTNFVLSYLKWVPGKIEFILEPLYIYNFGTETSTVKVSSTIWSNWLKSYSDLKKWAEETSGGKLKLKTKILLSLILLRWRISHYRACRRTKNSK